MIFASFRNVRSITVHLSAIFLCIWIFVSFSEAKTINAQSCSLADVQSAVNSASSGDIVSLPAGSSKWSGSLKIEKTNITLQGSGIGSTIITAGSKAITLSGESANNLRITGIELNNCSQCIHAAGTGTPRQAIKNFRIDHSKFTNDNVVFETTGGATGVFDHCEFVNTYGARLYGSNNASVKPPYKLGTSDAVFFEDNKITITPGGTARHFLASNSHSKYVVRHNVFDYGTSQWDLIDAHGACEVKGRGSATWEIYDNTFKLVPSISRVIHLRGGQGVVFNNTLNYSGNYVPTKPITITDYAYCNPPCSQSCTSYPCPDQINRSYFWNNKLGDKLINPVNACAGFIKLDRDYFQYKMPDYSSFTYPHPLTSGLQKPTSTISLQKRAVVYDKFTITPDIQKIKTLVSYILDERASVSISIYSVNGVLIETLVNEYQTSGSHSITWDATQVPKGLYIMRTSIGDSHRNFKLVR